MLGTCEQELGSDVNHALNAAGRAVLSEPVE